MTPAEVWYYSGMLKIEDKNIQELTRDLEKFTKRAAPYVINGTLNAAAFDTMRNWKGGVRDKLTLRNRFTEKSIRVVPSRSLQKGSQEAVVGSIAEYMVDQEFSGVERSKGRYGVPIATGYSAGQEGARPRSRLPRRPNTLKSIQMKARGLGANRKQRWIRTVQIAVDTGKRFVFMDLGGGKRKGIMKVIGGRKNTKRGWPKGARLKMIHDLTHQTVRIPATPTLGPAVEMSNRKLDEFHRKALIQQIKRQKLFKR